MEPPSIFDGFGGLAVGLVVGGLIALGLKKYGIGVVMLGAAAFIIIALRSSG